MRDSRIHCDCLCTSMCMCVCVHSVSEIAAWRSSGSHQWNWGLFVITIDFIFAASKAIIWTFIGAPLFNCSSVLLYFDHTKCLLFCVFIFPLCFPNPTELLFLIFSQPFPRLTLLHSIDKVDVEAINLLYIYKNKYTCTKYTCTKIV